MAQFIYTYTFSSEFETLGSVTITFEAPSKEDLVTGLTCALIDFKTKVERIREESLILEKRQDISISGSHKRKPNMDVYRRLSEQQAKLRQQSHSFTYEGRVYKYDDFVERDWKNGDALIDLEYHIQSIEEYIQEHLAPKN